MLRLAFTLVLVASAAQAQDDDQMKQMMDNIINNGGSAEDMMKMMNMMNLMKGAMGWGGWGGKEQSSCDDTCPNRQFMLMSDPKSFEEAQDECWLRGGTLARPRDTKGYLQLAKMVKANQTAPGYWIDLKRGVNQTAFQWGDGEKLDNSLSGWTLWGPGRPLSNLGAGDAGCVELRLTEGRGNGGDFFDGWSDAPCAQPKPFVCQTCQQREEPQETNTIVRTINCPGFADVAFILDSSGSVGQDNFKKQLRFVGDVAANFELGRGQDRGYQVSVVSFSGNVQEEFKLNQYEDIQGLKRAIAGIKWMAQGTATDSALQFAKDEVFLASKGARQGAVKIVIVMTDGKSARPSATASMARELRAQGGMVLAIGVGDGVDEAELKAIASSSKNVFRAASFDVLESIKREVEKRACTITVEEGGAVLADGASRAAYLAFVEEQRKFEAEIQRQQDILDSIRNFEHPTPAPEKEEEKEEEEEDSVEMMEYKISVMGHEMAQYEKLQMMKMEVEHAYYFKVATHMIRFCPLDFAAKMEVSRFFMHGEESWKDGSATECDMEDMPVVVSGDAFSVAQQLVSLDKDDQVKAFFGGLKDSVCAGLKTYLSEVRGWAAAYPDFSNMF